MTSLFNRVLRLLFAVAALPLLEAFTANHALSSFAFVRTARECPVVLSAVWEDSDLFEDEPELVEVAEKFIHAKYKQKAEENGSKFMTKDDCLEVLRGLLPPLTPDELDEEVKKTLELLLSDNKSTEEKIDEESFVKAVYRNTYWQEAGDLVVKELIYFDALYSYYKTGTNLLDNDDYETLKEDLTWEGSSVATMNKNEAMFVTAVASARRGTPVMDDAEYKSLKDTLKGQNSWVTARAPDALEKMGLATFMGYLHRAL